MGRVRVVSLDLAEAERVALALERFGCEARASALNVAELRKRHDEQELTLLVHFCEGRTLLVDRDGLYTSWLPRNVALALSNVATSRGLASEEVVAELVTSGQVSIGDLHDASRFLTWHSTPSATQLRRLKDLSDQQLLPPDDDASLRHTLSRRVKRVAVPVLATLATSLRSFRRSNDVVPRPRPLARPNSVCV